jgi:hypothetical protein
MFGHPSGQSEPGARTAVGIAGIARDAVRRGQVLVRAGDPWQSTSALDVELALDASAPAGAHPRVPESASTSGRPRSWPGSILAPRSNRASGDSRASPSRPRLRLEEATAS